MSKRSEVKVVMEGRKSGFGSEPQGAETLGFSPIGIGQHCPQACPYPKVPGSPLGGAMNIEDVAMLLGCSVWTVRQRYLPQGLPHIRASHSGKFVFFREQVIDWILKRQAKGERK